jgi:hypothetical protein
MVSSPDPTPIIHGNASIPEPEKNEVSPSLRESRYSPIGSSVGVRKLSTSPVNVNTSYEVT